METVLVSWSVGLTERNRPSVCVTVVTVVRTVAKICALVVVATAFASVGNAFVTQVGKALIVKLPKFVKVHPKKDLALETVSANMESATAMLVLKAKVAKYRANALTNATVMEFAGKENVSATQVGLVKHVANLATRKLAKV